VDFSRRGSLSITFLILCCWHLWITGLSKTFFTADASALQGVDDH
jgi:hypothetical protein